MTWAEFKAAVEAKGVKDSDEIEFIHVDTAKVEVNRDVYSDGTGNFFVTDDWS